MTLDPFRVQNIAVLTSTTASQTVTFPGTDGETAQIIVRNGAANPVYLAAGASVAIPGGTPSTSTVGIIEVGANTTQTFDFSFGGGTIAYIAATAGGSLTIMTGVGI